MSKSISDKTVRNPGLNTPFSEILEKNLSRRTMMRGGLAAAFATMTSLGWPAVTAAMTMTTPSVVQTPTRIRIPKSPAPNPRPPSSWASTPCPPR